MAAMSTEEFQAAVASAAAAAANAASRQLLQGPPAHWLGAGGQGQAYQQQQLQQQQQQQQLQQQQMLQQQQQMRQQMYSSSAQMASRQQPAATQHQVATGAECAASAAADSSSGLGQLNASLQLLAQQHAAQHATEAEARRAVELELSSLREAHEQLRLQHGAMSRPRPMRPARADWPRLAGTGGSLWHGLALTGASGAPAGRRLSQLVLDTGTATLT